jgi:hypothetical protein
MWKEGCFCMIERCWIDLAHMPSCKNSNLFRIHENSTHIKSCPLK